MNTFTENIMGLIAKAQNRMARQEGQGALEYIAIVIGLIILIAAGFQIAGVDIFSQASGFVSKVLSAAGNQ
jgi:hypothetical protein